MPFEFSDQRPLPPRISRSIARRVDLAQAWRERLDVPLMRFGLTRGGWGKHLFRAGNFLNDLLQGAGAGHWPQHPGRAHLAALQTDLRFREKPVYRNYWHDPERNALIGLHLGIDLNRFDGRYYLIENNIGPAMREMRRAIYPEPIDPVLSGLAEVADEHGFRTITLYARRWSEAQLEEVRLASVELGVQIEPVQSYGTLPPIPGVRLVSRMPDPLPRDSLHVIYRPVFMTPMMHWVHDKELVQVWYSRLVDSIDTRLATVEWGRSLFIPPHRGDRWPNLVVKLAEIDKGRAVVIGRFDTEAEARAALGLPDSGEAVPDVFRDVAGNWLLGLFDGKRRVNYQGFAPAEIVEGRLRSIRLHGFVSPLGNRFLSAHGLIAGQELPETLENGLLGKHDAFVLKRATALRFERLGDAVEEELVQVTKDFGQIMGRAIRERFDVTPND
ncbi:hypothetical protein KX928_15405 [Roseobacter sp. YSTF-M11]|uniref:Uncharacterized protein n=1 Tax=Roseobacter insulae TaxID=2859783 RepID=A0A9X1FYC8_9RHOB|nr:hypothetical protein [Roseobacter insulae]MBW4709178.1 hypothetical protein [Roseobacter insulae]